MALEHPEMLALGGRGWEGSCSKDVWTSWKRSLQGPWVQLAGNKMRCQNRGGLSSKSEEL